MKFASKTELLGKEYTKAKKWTLLANHGDKTMIRNALTYDLGKFMGFTFCPAAVFVDLFLNGNYRGTYQISDQVEVYSDGDVISDTCEITKVDTKEWLEETFTPKRERDNIDVFDLSYESLTLSARQSWYTPSAFPSCPPNIDNGLISYRDNLGIGAVLCSNRDFKLFVIDRAIIPDKDDMIVLCTNNDGENVWGAFSLISVEIVRDKYIHSIIRRFGNRERATRFYRLIIGEEEWTDEDLIMWDT